MIQQISYNCEADCTVSMQCCKSVVLVVISQVGRGGGGGAAAAAAAAAAAVRTTYTLPLDQSEHRILLHFSAT